MSDVAGGKRALADWLEARLGLASAWRALAGRPVTRGWGRVPGAVLLGLIGWQVLSGVGLAAHYAPATTTAWGSIYHLEEHVPGGRLLRSGHAWGAGAVVVLLGLHLLTAGWRRAYRAPREAAWVLGLASGATVLGFALTGYLLPWDQKGYWATTVATGIARATPLVGGALARLLQGGPELGNLTLTRFYALHVLVLPATLALLILLHLRALGRAAPDPACEPPAAGPWWPRAALRDALGLTAALGAVLVLAALREAGLEAPADPTSDYPPRPEWYFAPLRQLLKTVPEPWGSLVVPGLVASLWLALPWLDSPVRPRPRAARLALGLPVLAAVLLGLQAHLADLADEGFQAARRAAEREAVVARRLAAAGIPGDGAGELLWRDPPRLGARLFARHCQGCHPLEGMGGEEAPDLTGYLSLSWLEGVIRDPRDPRFFGRTKLDDMDPLPREAWGELRALASFVAAQDPARRPELDPALVARGELAFVEQECNACHELEPGKASLGPTLGGYGTAEWLREFLRDPGQPHFYGADNDMPGYAEELSAEELAALVVFLRGLGAAPEPER